MLSEESLKKAFGAVWRRFMEFEITRSRMMADVAGNPVSALILQVVAYHNLTLIQVGVKNQHYSNIREGWELSENHSANVLPKKLSYAAISDMTGFDKETVRRSVKKLEEHGWLSIDSKTGINYKPLTSNQDKLLMFNEWEITQLGRLLKRVNDFQDTK